jgi:hypothetical protein
MPQQGWSDKRERQYQHIKEGLEDRGREEDTAEEIAARTVNKERARHGEARQASRTSTDDISSSRRGGLRSHRGPGRPHEGPAVPGGAARTSRVARRRTRQSSSEPSAAEIAWHQRWSALFTL